MKILNKIQKKTANFLPDNFFSKIEVRQRVSMSKNSEILIIKISRKKTIDYIFGLNLRKRPDSNQSHFVD